MTSKPCLTRLLPVTSLTVTSLTATRLTATLLGSMVLSLSPVSALPPPADEPEEVLRTEIILEARSPIDGEPLTAAEYAELQAQIEAENRAVGTVPPRLRELITLLRIRKVLRTILPFLP